MLKQSKSKIKASLQGRLTDEQIELIRKAARKRKAQSMARRWHEEWVEECYLDFPPEDADEALRYLRDECMKALAFINAILGPKSNATQEQKAMRLMAEFRSTWKNRDRDDAWAICFDLVRERGKGVRLSDATAKWLEENKDELFKDCPHPTTTRPTIDNMREFLIKRFGITLAKQTIHKLNK